MKLTVNKELKEIEEKLSKLYTKKENIGNDLGKTEETLWKQEDLLTKLENERNNMPYRNHFKISIYVGIIALVSLIFGFSMYIYGLVKLLLLFSTLDQGVLALILFFSSILGFLGVELVCRKIINKIQKKLEKNSKLRITNSNEYQELLSRINVLTNDIEVTRNNFSNKSKDYELANEEYETCKKDRDEKKILVEYISKQMRPTETTLHKSKSYKREHCGDNSCSCF